LGNALAAQLRWQAAADEYAEALRLMPGSAEAQFGLGRSLAAMGKRPEAVSHLQEALRLRPDYPAARQLMEGLEP